MTPDEFVRAGDFLCRTCPTWSWEAGDPGKARSFLPKQKQFLVTRGVPSRRRAAAVEGYGGGDGDGIGGGGDAFEAGGMEGDDEGWVAPPPTAEAAAEAAEAAEAEADEEEGAKEQAAAPKAQAKAEEKEEAEEEDGNEDDIPDLDDLEIVDEGDIDEAALPPAAVAASAAARAAKKAANENQNQRNNAHVVAVRTYDLSITYDKYYQVPRFWLAGFDEDRRPLSAEALLEDVAAEHARKTVTMEPHPHLSLSSSSSSSGPSSSNSSSSSSIKVASIHPCRHAAVMKKLASMGAAAGSGSSGSARATAEAASEAGAAAEKAPPPPTTALDPEAYLVLFLKFIASVIPTIEYDFTMHASVGGGGGR